MFLTFNPVNTKHLYNIYTMLDQRRRRCISVNTNVLCLMGSADRDISGF